MRNITAGATPSSWSEALQTFKLSSTTSMKRKLCFPSFSFKDVLQSEPATGYSVVVRGDGHQEIFSGYQVILPQKFSIAIFPLVNTQGSSGVVVSETGCNH